MKVIFVSPFGKTLVGGIVKWTEHIVNFHKKNPNAIDLTLLYNENPIPLQEGTSMLHRIYKGLKNYYPLCSNFKKKTNIEHFDVAHISTSASISLIKDLIIARIAYKRGIKTVFHFHFGRIPEILKFGGWEKKLLDKLLKIASCGVVMDKASYNALTDSGYVNIRYLPNPLALSVSEIIEAKSVNIKRKERKIVFAGHVVPTKGVFELVEACCNISNIQLRILGQVKDEIKKELEEKAGPNKDNWLDITGNVSFETIIEEMLSCDIFVLPTYTEGFPNVILESMACGCAIVTTPVGAIPEILEEENGKHYGILVAPKNIEELKRGIEQMLNNEELKEECRKNAKQRVNERYNIATVWQQLVSIWKEVCIKV